MSASHTFWLRAEVKPNEFRTLIMPEHAKQLLDAGHKVFVERSVDRCVLDSAFEQVGCTLVETGSWTTAPREALICGLKELPESNEPLVHNHVYFAHCYKGQAGADELMQRFVVGGGDLWDLEFLVNEQGRRVAAFGKSAGVVGMALGLWTWANQVLGTSPALSPLTKPYADWDALVAEVKAVTDRAIAKSGAAPKAIVIGALGRCGVGALEFAAKCGLLEHVTKWDLEETKKGGPFTEILDHDIMLNCIYLMTKIPPFVTLDMIKESNSRKLGVVVDVSCDASNPNNPLPIYNGITTFLDPLIHVVEGDKPVDVIAIDHLPSLVPSESSSEFAGLMISHLLEFGKSGVWTRAGDLFQQKSAHLRQ